MKPDSQTTAPDPAFAEVRQQITEWRETRTSRGRMSKELWASAVSLAKKHGISKTSIALRLSYDSLKKHLLRSEGGNATKSPCPSHRQGFLQTKASELLDPANTSDTLIEISTKDGAKLTMRLGADSAIDLPSLVSAFRGHRR